MAGFYFFDMLHPVKMTVNNAKWLKCLFFVHSLPFSTFSFNYFNYFQVNNGKMMVILLPPKYSSQIMNNCG